MSRSLFAAILVSALASACGSPTYLFAPDPDAADATDDATTADAGTDAPDDVDSDAAVDASGDTDDDVAVTDTGVDADPDTGADTGADADSDTVEADTTGDTGLDTDPADTTDDVAADTTADVADATTDTTPDTPPDVVADTAPDVGVDTTPDVRDTGVDTTPDVRDTGVDTTPDVRDTGVDTTPDTAVDTDTGPSCTPVSEVRDVLGLTDLTMCEVVVTYVFDDGFFVQDIVDTTAAIMVYEETSWTNPDGIAVGDVIQLDVYETIDYFGTAEITDHSPIDIVERGRDVTSLIRNLSAGVLPDESIESHVARINGAVVTSFADRNIYVRYGAADNLLIRTNEALGLCVGARFDIIAPVTEWTPEFGHRLYAYDASDVYNIDLSPCGSGHPPATIHDLVINEVLADPPPEDGFGAGDANCDGSRDSVEDEFIEIVNVSGATVDIGGVTLSDSSAQRFIFPTGFTLGAGRAVVVFGGGSVWEFACDFGGSQVITAAGLGLTNIADTITMVVGDDDTTFSYTIGELDQDQSATRSPDLTGGFILHSSADVFGGRLHSPGTRADGSAF